MNICRFENSFWNSNTWLLSNPGASVCYLVDCGDVEPLVAVLEERNWFLGGIFLTHTHFDHIYGLNAALKRYPAVKVFTNDYGKAGLQSDQLNLSRYGGTPFVFEYPENVICRHEGERVSLWQGLDLLIYETPGHNPGCLTFQCGSSFFTGDAYIPGLKVVTNLPHCDNDLAQKSLQRILTLSADGQIYPGHGKSIEKE